MPVTGVAGVKGFSRHVRWARAVAPLRVGRLRQAAVRRAEGGPCLSRALHPSGRHLELQLIAFDEAGVTFKWKDYRISGGERLKTMTFDTAEFARRFLLHVLPNGFHRIRHYGLFAGAVRAHNSERVRHAKPPPERPPAKADVTGKHLRQRIDAPLRRPMVIIERSKRAPRGPPPPNRFRIDTS